MKNKESEENILSSRDIAKDYALKPDASSSLMRDGKKLEASQNESDKSKRTFLYLRHLILIALLKGPQTINQISINSGINWKTAENHLTHLTGKGLIALLYQTPYLKIYQLTDKGKQYLEYVKEKYQKEHIHHVDFENAENLNGMIKEFALVWHRNENGTNPNGRGSVR